MNLAFKLSPDSIRSSIGSVTLGALLEFAAIAATPAATLPVPCSGGSCGSGPAVWVTGTGSATYSSAGNAAIINQTSDRVILNWASFDVAAGNSVTFNQPSAASIALNRIYQASPSQIFGMVKANGQIYLINQNGFVFGSTARVNVAGLLASSLWMSDSTFNSGLLSAATNLLPALSSDRRADVTDNAGSLVLDSNGQPMPIQITLAPGAQISTTGAGGRVLLASRSVLNGGAISAPDGQAILASGEDLYVQASTDPKLRGLLVEVNGGGVTTNQITGDISSDRGNVTLIGLAVNQDGRVSATTSTAANGSVRLLARDTVTPTLGEGGVVLVQPTRGGQLELGSSSTTTVLPDPTDTSTVVDDEVQLPSTLELRGQTVVLSSGSQIKAPSGQLTITAASDPSATISSGDPGAIIRMDAGASIDLSGSTVSVPVTRNLLTVELRGTELADDPQQRNGALRGQTVVVDARVGTPLANVSGEEQLIQRDILERTSTGGSATFTSGGDVAIAPGARIDVSGGAVNYTPGILQTTALIRADGSTVDIGAASPNDTYIGLVNPIYKFVSDRWGIVNYIASSWIGRSDPGYVQGASAGTLAVAAPSMILDGTFVGRAINGPFQRNGVGVAQGGLFEVGLTPSNNSNPFDYLAPSITLSNSRSGVAFDDSAPLPLGQTLQLPVDFIQNGGFSRVQLASNTSVVLPSGLPLSLPAGGALTLTAPNVTVNSPISIPAGSITLQSAVPQSVLPAPGTTAGVFIGDNVAINVDGLFTNDLVAPQTVRPVGFDQYNAGSIKLNQSMPGGTLALGSAVTLSADGGAWVQQSGAVTTGTGGSIALLSSMTSSGIPGDTTVRIGTGLQAEAFGVQNASGGSLTISAPRITVARTGDVAYAIAAQSVSTNTTSGSSLVLGSSLFSQHGFATFVLTANGAPLTGDTVGDVLTIASGTALDLQTATRLLNSDAQVYDSGAAIQTLTRPVLLPDYLRKNLSLTLNAVPATANSFLQVGGLEVAAGASVHTDPDSTIALNSVGNLKVDGTIIDRAGSAALTVLTPGATYDPGIISGLGLRLGSSAVIDVSGATTYLPNDTGLLTGSVLAGGSVSLIAQRGWVATDAGAVIDISGTQAPIDIAVTQPNPEWHRGVVASAAGSLLVAAPESVVLRGSLVAHAGVGDTGAAAGGSLEIDLSRNGASHTGFSGNFPVTAPRTIELTPGAGTVAMTAGLAAIDPAWFQSSGVDALTLLADGRIVFDAGANLSLARSITLQSSAIGVNGDAGVSVAAPYIALGTGLMSFTNVAGSADNPGSGRLQFSADDVDLIGYLALQGVSSAAITSSGAINLRGAELVSPGNDATITNLNTGALAISGNLTLAATRVVPSTGTRYAITASGGASNVVEFDQIGAATGVPLSVGGALSVAADGIVQAGTLWAPLGSISLSATRTLTLSSGSLTSVSADDAVLPYGRVDSSTSWVYGLNALLASPIVGIPQKNISLTGGSVTLANGATVDVSGGGDLQSYLWTPGTGGTKDSLAGAVSPGLYSVIPGLGTSYAPYDPLMYEGSGLTPGAAVYLAGGGGLPTGVYALLPARYALLPGAYLVSAVPGFDDLQPGTAANTADGAVVVAGYRTFGNIGVGGTRYTGFAVRPGSYAHQMADYADELASAFFASTTSTNPWTQRIPADAGLLSIGVSSGLTALGSVRGAAGAGGRSATVAVSAPQLQIDPSVTTNGTDGVVHVAASVLDGWNAGSLILGGQVESDGTLRLGANSSTISVASGSLLSANEIVLMADDAINVGTGSIIESSSYAGSAGPSYAGTSSIPTALALTGIGAGGAAVLAVSDLNNLITVRPNDGSINTGTVNIGGGATIGSDGAVLISAPAGGVIADGVVKGPRARWSLEADQIAFGSAGAESGVLMIDADLAGALATARSVRISAANTIDLLQPVNLGAGPTGMAIESITLLATSIDNLAAGASSAFSAQTVVLGNGSGGVAIPSVGAGSGALTVNADEIDVGAGVLGLSGFSQTTLSAAGGVVGRGSGGLASSGDLDVSAGVLTTESGATTSIEAPNGTLRVAGLSGTGAITPGIGGLLSLSARSVIDQAAIVLPSGEVNIDADQSLILQSGAEINVSGVTPVFAAHGSDGGVITLRSGGTLSLDATSGLNVAGGQAANAGQIVAVASGSSNLAGQLIGAADSGYIGGSFSIDAGVLQNFNALNQVLEGAGFSEERDFEARQGDLDLESVLTTRHVRLTADAGAITIGGSIDASGAGEVGSVNLAALNNLTVTGLVRANGTSGASGGAIALATQSGTLTVSPTATIEASGANGSGRLALRAPLVAGDIAAQIGGTLTADQVSIEPELSYVFATGAPTASNLATFRSSIASVMSTASSTIASRLNPGAAANVAVRPYVTFSYGGDLMLPALDLFASNWRFGARALPADINIRAAGSIELRGTVSDGFKTVGTGSSKYLTLTANTGAAPTSSSIGVIAGADLASVDPTATVADAPADLTFDQNVAIRTGTGSLSLAAARDINFGTGASAYTGGAIAVTTTTTVARTTTYATAGGSVMVNAGRDILADPTTQLADEWLPRTGRTAASWGINFNKFAWSVGALGGGEVRISAGRDAVNLSAASADSAFASTTGVLQSYGGGSLALTTGRDLESGHFYVARGSGRITAEGALSSDWSDFVQGPIGTLLELGDASFSVGARQGVLLAGVLQPTVLNPISAASPDYFFRYSPNSSLRMDSWGGDVTMASDQAGVFLSGLAGQTGAGNIMPANVDIESFAGDVDVSGTLTVFASPAGGLSIAAARDIAASASASTISPILLADSDPSIIPTATSVTVNSNAPANELGTYRSTDLRAGDATPVIVSAGRDINGLNLELSKFATVTAGRDIHDLIFDGENLNPDDVTLIRAGRDILYSTNTAAHVSLSGPGGLDFIAGRNIDLGYSAGVTTLGTTLNANIPSATGADVLLLTGASGPLGLNTAPQSGTPDFVSDIILPSAEYQQQLMAYVQQLTGVSSQTFMQALVSFRNLSEAQQLPLVANVFFSELVRSGREANSNSTAGFTRGYAAVDALFPSSRGLSVSPDAGDLSLTFSRIYTLDGGSISLLVPGGAVNVGLANPPAFLTASTGLNRQPSELGIVAERAGNVHIFADRDVLVNSSRIFTLLGGNIAIWSTEGNIDAGRGAKTAVSAAPPIVTVDASGNVTVLASGAATGSGIRTIVTELGVNPGDVDLIAPSGFVNAGDAGIGAAGNLNIAAQHVIGLDNIQVGGTATGVPPETSGLGVTLAAAAGAGSSTGNAANEAVNNGSGARDSSAPLAQSALSWLEVFIMGLGEETCRQDDLDCLKRQKPN